MVRIALVATLAVALAAVVLAPTAARADVLLYEGFDYAAGSTLGGQGSGTGFGSNVWTGIDGGSITGGSIGTGLTYNDGTNDLQTSGGHYSHTRLSGGSSGYRVHRKIDVASIGASNPEVTFEDTTTYTPGHHIGKDGSTVWFSFIYQSGWDGFSNGGGTNNWGGVSFQDGDANLNGSVDGNSATFVTLDPDPTDLDFPEDERTLRAYDGRGDMGGEKNGEQVFSLTAHNSKTVQDESGGPLVNDSTPTFVLLRMDFQGDPSDPNGTNEYYETWPNAIDQADEIRMWLNPSLSSEPAVGTENVLLEYEGFFGRDDGGFKIYADRFDFKFDGFYINARADGTLYDEIRMGTTFGDVAPIAGGVVDVDLDDDGDVDGADFLAIQRTNPSLIPDWETAYGTSGLSAAANSVPEPTTLALGLLSLAGLALSRRRS